MSVLAAAQRKGMEERKRKVMPFELSQQGRVLQRKSEKAQNMGVCEGTHIDFDQKEIAKKEEKDLVRWADPTGSHSSL